MNKMVFKNISAKSKYSYFQRRCSVYNNLGLFSVNSKISRVEYRQKGNAVAKDLVCITI